MKQSNNNNVLISQNNKKTTDMKKLYEQKKKVDIYVDTDHAHTDTPLKVHSSLLGLLNFVFFPYSIIIIQSVIYIFINF